MLYEYETSDWLSGEKASCRHNIIRYLLPFHAYAVWGDRCRLRPCALRTVAHAVRQACHDVPSPVGQTQPTCGILSIALSMVTVSQLMQWGSASWAKAVRVTLCT